MTLSHHAAVSRQENFFIRVPLKTARFILMCSSAYYFIDEKKECDVSKAIHKMRVDML